MKILRPGFFAFLAMAWFASCDRVIDKRSLARNDLRNMVAAIEGYHVEYGGYPPVDEAACLAALMGANPRKIIFIEVPLSKLDSKGRFLDGWGVPYRISITPEGAITVISSGPDRVFGSRDDLEEKK